MNITIVGRKCNPREDFRARAEKRLSSGDANINIARAELSLRKSLIRIQLAQK